MTVQEYKQQLKLVNKNFQSNFLYRDSSYNALTALGLDPSDITFGFRTKPNNLYVLTSSQLIYVDEATRATVYDLKDAALIGNSKGVVFSDITLSFNTDVLIIKDIPKLDFEQLLPIFGNNNEKQPVVNFKNFNFDMSNLKIKIVASNFPDGYKYKTSKKELFMEKSALFSSTDKINISNSVISIEQITEENKSSLTKKIGWGFLGSTAGLIAFPLGIAGLAAGAIIKGKSKEIYFSCELSNGYKFLATADNEVYKKFQALATF